MAELSTTLVGIKARPTSFVSIFRHTAESDRGCYPPNKKKISSSHRVGNYTTSYPRKNIRWRPKCLIVRRYIVILMSLDDVVSGAKWTCSFIFFFFFGQHPGAIDFEIGRLKTGSRLVCVRLVSATDPSHEATAFRACPVNEE